MSREMHLTQGIHRGEFCKTTKLNRQKKIVSGPTGEFFNLLCISTRLVFARLFQPLRLFGGLSDFGSQLS